MLRNDTLVTSIEPISHWNFTKLEYCEGVFSWMTGITRVDLESWDMSHVTNISKMFNHCTGLTNIEGIRNWDVSKVTNMSYLFYYATSLTSIEPIEGWTTTSLEDMSSAFTSVTKMPSIDLTHWDVSKVKNMAGLFADCYVLRNIDLTGWNTSNVTSMAHMFNCIDASVLDLSSFDTRKVTSFKRMFNNSSKLTTIYIGENWDTSANTDEAIYVFNKTTNLPNFDENNNTRQYLEWAKPTTEGGYLTLKTNN